MAYPDYLVATGFNIPFIDLLLIVPQPKTNGIRVTRRSNAVNSRVSDEGLYILFEWNVLQDAPMYQDILTLFDVLDNKVAPVTIYARDGRLIWGRWNGRAIQPEAANDFEWNNFRPHNLKLLVKDLKPST